MPRANAGKPKSPEHAAKLHINVAKATATRIANAAASLAQPGKDPAP